MKRRVGWFGKAAAVVLAGGMTLAANAGGWIAHVKLYDDTVVTVELAGVPKPDSDGMYHLHLKDMGNLIVHVSNVWIIEKSSKTKPKK